jgi:hypothetical protein
MHIRPKESNEYLAEFYRYFNYTSLKFLKMTLAQYFKTKYEARKKYAFGLRRKMEKLTLSM